MQPSDRHQAILELIAVNSISRQDELARLLNEKGFNVTQASVSRDLDRLGIQKVKGRYVRAAPSRFGAFGPVSITKAGSDMVVVRCAAGLASAAAVRIDSAAIPEIVGTIAGDDTIFVAVDGARDQSRVLKALFEIFEANEGNDNS